MTAPADLASHARRIEEAGLNALQTQRQLFYDGWVLRLSPGRAKRGRSVSAHFESSLPLDEKIAYCEAVYARHRLPLLFRITPFSRPPGLAAALKGHGYVPFDETLVQAVALDVLPDLPPLQDGVRARAVDAATFADAVGRLRGYDAVQRDAHLERLAQSPLETRFVVVEAFGETVASAQMAGDRDVVGLFDVITAEGHRGHGHATAAVGRLLAWAWEHAMRLVYLQVTATNAPALAIYRKLGFRTVYSYHYLARPRDVER